MRLKKERTGKIMKAKVVKNFFLAVGIRVDHGVYNCDFDNAPRTSGNGQLTASPFKLKKAVRMYWNSIGESIVALARNKSGTNIPMTAEEVYEAIFGTKLKNDSQITILRNLLSTTDTRAFGCVCATKPNPVSSRGVVQVTTGVNKCEDSIVKEYDVNSPYRNSAETKADNKHTTLGTRTEIDVAHYVHSVSVNPKNMEDIDGVEPYNTEDYNLLIKALANAVTYYNSASMSGCKNELLIIVETAIENVALNPIADYIRIENDELILDDLLAYLTLLGDKIASVKVYYSSQYIKVKENDMIELHHLEELQ